MTIPYRLGVDLGTTYSAAALAREDGVAVVPLGHAAVDVPSGQMRVDVPSTVCVAADGSLVVGEAAEALAAERPTAVAREFKRRLGDHIPLIIDGRPFSPQTLMAQVLRWTVGQVTHREGLPPELLTVTCPANWGPYKHELLRQVIRMADVPSTIICTEPEAAAVRHAGADAQREGALVGIYDLGGGTFDAAVLRATGSGAFTLAGPPEGIEHLGGIDFDEAVFSSVLTALGHEAQDLASSEDPANVAAMAAVRRRCVAAKERLSVDQVATVEVDLPGLSTSVRITRGEFEAMIRPALDDTVAAFERAVRGADTTAGALTSIVLVGGSVRIPLIFESLSRRLDCQVIMPRNPAHSVALGAAMMAQRYRVPARPTGRGRPPRPRPVAAAEAAPPARTRPARDAILSAREVLRLPADGQAMLTEWLVRPGEPVSLGQPIARARTASGGRGSVTTLVRSPFEGVVQRTFLDAGSLIRADDLLVGYQQVGAYLNRPSRVLPSDVGLRIEIRPPRSATAVAGRPVISVDRVPRGLWWSARFCLLAEPGQHLISAAYVRNNQWFGFASQLVQVPQTGLLDLVYTEPGLGVTGVLSSVSEPVMGGGRLVAPS